MLKGDEIIQDLVSGYCLAVKSEVYKRIDAIGFDLDIEEKHSVLGGLLARQGTLACEFSKAPSMWNPHIAPLFYRTMVDLYITLGWILLDLKTRCRLYIEYGLGQAKLQLEHLKVHIENKGDDPNDDETVKYSELWINAQKYTFLLTVDVGNWAGKNAREMAKEANLIDIYNYVYSPFSSYVHNSWDCVCRMNTKRSDSALQRYTFIPDMPEYHPDPHMLYFVTEYFDKTTQLLDEKLSLGPFEGSLGTWLDAKFDEIGKNNKKGTR